MNSQTTMNVTNIIADTTAKWIMIGHVKVPKYYFFDEHCQGPVQTIFYRNYIDDDDELKMNQ